MAIIEAIIHAQALMFAVVQLCILRILNRDPNSRYRRAFTGVAVATVLSRDAVLF